MRTPCGGNLLRVGECDSLPFHEGNQTVGVSARTIQLWLRHSDLETTLKYFAANDHKSEKTREQVNNTFALVRVTA